MEKPMITLFGFGPAFGLPDPSPFVMKTDVQLKMAALVSVSSTPARTERGQSSVPEAIHEQAQAQARKSVRAALEGHQLSRHSEAKTVKLGARSLEHFPISTHRIPLRRDSFDIRVG